MQKLFMLVFLFTISGCAAINENVVRGVNAYCAEPFVSRQQYRDIVNAALADNGHSISVHCEGDPID
jgi:hypothetical protein